jgi:hypothetical protein
MMLRNLAANGFLTHLSRVAGPGAGVTVMLSGKHPRYRALDTYVDGDFTADYSGKIKGRAKVSDVTMASYYDGSEVKNAGTLELDELDTRELQVEIDDYEEWVDDPKRVEITVTVSSLDNEMVGAGFVRVKAPKYLDVTANVDVELSYEGEYLGSYEAEVTGTLKTTSAFQHAFDDLDELDRQDFKYASWTFLPGKVASDDLAARWGERISLDKTALKIKKLKKLLSKGGQFGVLSGYGKGSKSENQANHGRLTGLLQKKGLRPVELKGKWAGVAEKSYLVPNMRFSDLIELGRLFKQESVIFKSTDGVLGMYYLRENAVEFAVDDAGNMAVDVAVEPKRYKDERDRVERGQPGLYSKSRGVSFEFGVLWGQKRPWNGRSPYTRDVVEGLVSRGDVRAR